MGSFTEGGGGIGCTVEERGGKVVLYFLYRLS